MACATATVYLEAPHELWQLREARALARPQQPLQRGDGHRAHDRVALELKRRTCVGRGAHDGDGRHGRARRVEADGGGSVAVANDHAPGLEPLPPRREDGRRRAAFQPPNVEVRLHRRRVERNAPAQVSSPEARSRAHANVLLIHTRARTELYRQQKYSRLMLQRKEGETGERRSG